MRAFLLLGLLLVAGTPSRAEDYLRLRQSAQDARHLEIAVRRFRIGGEAEARDVVLVGVAHIGTADYYRRLQRRLDGADRVLYEGVDGHREAFRHLKRQANEGGRNPLQAKMARALGLEFQLFAIDYDREHFHNSDVTSAQLRDLFNGKELVEGADVDEGDMETLFRNMQALGPGGQVMASLLEALEARPHWGRAMRWSMASVMGQLKGHISDYPGIPPNLRQILHVLLEKRNDVVMRDIRDTLRDLQPGETLAVFYGAAHMADFERRLKRDHQARVVDTEWLEAFGGNLHTSGLNVLERAMVRGFLRQQLATLRRITGDDTEPSSTPDSAPPTRNDAPTTP